MTISAVREPAGPSSVSDQARLRADKVRVAALIELISREHNIRCLAAGGPIFAQLGLISPRVSPTATVIVDPMHQLQLVLALEGEGWSRVTQSNTGGLLPPVFTRVVHPRLVCPLDIYDIFPGFYAPPAEVFERLWSRRATLTLGRTAVSSLDRVSTVLVAGHDQLGSLARNERSVSNIDYFVSMFRTSLTPREQEAFVRLVSEVEGIEPLRPFLMAIGVRVGEITLPSVVYCQARLGIAHVSDSLIFAVSLFEAPPGRRFAGFRSIFRRHPKRVMLALLASPRSFAVVAGSRARHRRQQLAAPPQA
ncbi:hypothetical protein [Lacisediminihabitans profunda]|uniref:Nucleotidyltransferase family protein n=1 Tax=Lacisediminihabitans profunda TaxID=2594790 RepID=A0A5C8UVI1_9MICO|nr:hypothetical protein [Lacisediminihabitans profunda]TXN32340.1 hypothetical protein FVP33_01595 [Lacisediminihabitans profunda]